LWRTLNIGDLRVRMVEYSPGYLADHWCDRGHVLFVVAGELMTQGSLARRLIDVARAAFGFIPGGLAVAAVSGCVFFAAISGSSPVTVVAIGSIMVPALVKAKYPENFSIGLLTSAGSLGILIPPSIPMIVYSIMVGSTTPVDPTDLFIAGVVPGLFIGGMLAGYSMLVGKRLSIPTQPFSMKNLLEQSRRGFWSLLLPVIILGGIYSGTFTPTEAAAVSVVYALLVETLIHREIGLKKLVTVAESSMTVMGSLLIIIALAIALNHFLVLEQIPDQMVEWIKSQNLSPTAFLVIVNVFLLGVGCFMDIMSAILIIAPMLAPMASAMGIDPIHMGIIFIVNLEIGYLTPPVGLNLFVASTLFRKSLGFVIRSVAPTLGIMLGSLMLITWVPTLSLGLVRLIHGEPVFGREPATKPVPDPVKPTQPEPGPAVSEKKAKTLEEMMREAQQRRDDGDEAEEAGPKRVKTMEEMMREAQRLREQEEAAEEGGVADAPAADEPKRVKTMQEMMREAEEKRQREAQNVE
ncbi:MAG: TRAP transporter large permease subunit, partial [Myxococcales bacterium]